MLGEHVSAGPEPVTPVISAGALRLKTVPARRGSAGTSRIDSTARWSRSARRIPTVFYIGRDSAEANS